MAKEIYINWPELNANLEHERDRNIKQILDALDLIEPDINRRKVLREIVLDKFNCYHRFIIKNIEGIAL